MTNPITAVAISITSDSISGEKISKLSITARIAYNPKAAETKSNLLVLTLRYAIKESITRNAANIPLPKSKKSEMSELWAPISPA